MAAEDVRRLVGRNLARLRRAKGQTQEEVAARSCISQQYISGLELGRRNPTVATLQELARALGARPVDLLVPDGDGSERESARSSDGRPE